MEDRQFSPGFRLSIVDVAFVVIAVAAGAMLWNRYAWVSGVIAFVVLHFFLFCNVVRMSRPLELVWAAVFLTLAIGTVAFSVPGWAITYGLSLIATCVVVAIEARKPSYHGVLWQRINPNLRQWWDANS